MTVLLVLCTLVVFLIADYAVQRSRRLKAAVVAHAGIPFPADIALAPNHVWLRQEQGIATLGLDEFLTRMVGAVEEMIVPDVGDEVTPVTLNIALCDRDRSVQLASPMVGQVVALNSEVLKDPSLARSDPYGKGWLMKIRADRKATEAIPTMKGQKATEWLKEQSARAKQFLAEMSPTPQLATLMDGGEPAEGVLKQFNAATWKRFERHFTQLNREDSATRP